MAAFNKSAAAVRNMNQVLKDTNIIWVISIPLEIISLHDEGFHILVEVFIFGQPFKAVLDTGASKTVLDKTTVENFVEKETLLLSDKLSTGLGTNSMESFLISVAEFQVGGLTISGMEIAVLDLSMINYAYENLEIGPIIGVIGGDILMKYNAIIDYQKQKLFFNP